MTDAGAVATAVLLLASDTTAPPAGAGALSRSRARASLAVIGFNVNSVCTADGGRLNQTADGERLALCRHDEPAGYETPSIRKTCPAKVTTHAVSPTNSTDVGRSKPATTVLKVPMRVTLSSSPVFGDAGEPGGPLSQTPCARA